jgi:hypothetical protein
MSEAIPPLSQYAFMAWCSVKAQGQLYLPMHATRPAHSIFPYLRGQYFPHVVHIPSLQLKCCTHFGSVGRNLQPQASYRYEAVSKSFRTGRLERELKMVQLSATRCSCVAIL